MSVTQTFDQPLSNVWRIGELAFGCVGCYKYASTEYYMMDSGKKTHYMGVGVHNRVVIHCCFVNASCLFIENCHGMRASSLLLESHEDHLLSDYAWFCQTYWLREGSLCPTFLLEKIEIYLSKESSERNHNVEVPYWVPEHFTSFNSSSRHLEYVLGTIWAPSKTFFLKRLWLSWVSIDPRIEGTDSTAIA